MDGSEKRLAILFQLRGAHAMDHGHLIARLRLEVHHAGSVLPGNTT
ncbi:MAG: hypothetical protein ACLPPF_03010 [Rhodomicrobium sp.]